MPGSWSHLVQALPPLYMFSLQCLTGKADKTKPLLKINQTVAPLICRGHIYIVHQQWFRYTEINYSVLNNNYLRMILPNGNRAPLKLCTRFCSLPKTTVWMHYNFILVPNTQSTDLFQSRELHSLMNAVMPLAKLTLKVMCANSKGRIKARVKAIL